VEVEADLADRRHLRAPRERFEGRAVAGRVEILRFVRVDTDGGKDALAGRGEIGGRAESARVVPGTRNRDTPAARARARSSSAPSPICR
jgi:hypothetical protein